MNTFVELCALVVSALGQYLKSLPKIDNRLVFVAMCIVGIGCYAIITPPAKFGTPEFWAWLDAAKLWALALPGIASGIGTFTPMKTVVKDGS